MGLLLTRHYKQKAEEAKDYSALTVSELRELAQNKGVEGYTALKKDELIAALEG